MHEEMYMIRHEHVMSYCKTMFLERTVREGAKRGVNFIMGEERSTRENVDRDKV